MRRSAVLLVLGAALGPIALGAAACDGGNGTPRVAAADAPFCDAYGELLVGPLADVATDASDPAVLRSAVAATRTLVADLAAAAPEDVSAAAAELAEDYDETFAVLERHGFDLARVDAEATVEEREVLDGFGQTPAGPGADDPFSRLQRFVADRCAPEVTLPPELRETTSTSPTTSP